MRDQFDAVAFYATLDSHRVARGFTWKDVSAASGVSASTLTRMGQGKRPDVDSLAALLKWSGLRAQDFIRGGSRGDHTRAKKPEPLAQITAYLRADSNLTPASANAMEQIIRAAYQQFRGK